MKGVSGRCTPTSPWCANKQSRPCWHTGSNGAPVRAEDQQRLREHRLLLSHSRLKAACCVGTELSDGRLRGATRSRGSTTPPRRCLCRPLQRGLCVVGQGIVGKGLWLQGTQGPGGARLGQAFPMSVGPRRGLATCLGEEQRKLQATLLPVQREEHQSAPH